MELSEVARVRGPLPLVCCRPIFSSYGQFSA